MPEFPDFDAIARQIVEGCAGIADNSDEWIEAAIPRAVARVAEQLRLVWNARGAADIAKVEAEIPTVWTAAEPAGPLTRALRSLDR